MVIDVDGVQSKVPVYTNPECPHVPGSVEVLVEQALSPLLVYALASSLVVVVLLGASPVGPFVLSLRGSLEVVVSAAAGRAHQSSQNGAGRLPSRWRSSHSLSKSS